MSKKMKIEVKETNIDNTFDAYVLAKTQNGIKASNYREIPFKIKKWVVTQNVITDEETGEVQEMSCITIKTESGEVIGTNSRTMIENFLSYIDLMYDNNIELSTKEFMIQEGQGRNGKFNAITIL